MTHAVSLRNEGTTSDVLFLRDRVSTHEAGRQDIFTPLSITQKTI